MAPSNKEAVMRGPLADVRWRVRSSRRSKGEARSKDYLSKPGEKSE
jgi:hypothetical protein